MRDIPTEFFDSGGERAARVRRVVDECLRRRSAGEQLADEQVIAAHPDLVPELPHALHNLAVVQQAYRSADDEPDDSSGSAFCPRSGDLPAGLPDSIPGFEIMGEVHRGGQGVVYQAVQKATRRKVAIKVMREGPFAGNADRARFEREVQVLGALKHPNIITVHDSGTAGGAHYFVMDYVSGRPLDDYVRGLRSELIATRAGVRGASSAATMRGLRSEMEEILRLFAKICDAVNAAHVRGIIHRDLKPSNIRVDADGEPHILDFGLAKLAAAPGEAMTMTGEFIGSLPWASPEQAEGVPERVDMRTDVYSLGVILYQILTEQFPYEVVGKLRDVLDNIMRAEPARPSTIRRHINDEIETIILKCLAKERERRYQTAGELARDVRHYLAGEAIQAKRDSFAYVLRKQLRRHMSVVLVAGAFLILIVSSSIVSFTLWQQAVVERDAADAARRDAEDAERAATEAKRLADENAARAETQAARFAAINGFLNRMLTGADPAETKRRDFTVREALDSAIRDLNAGHLKDQPAVEAEARSTTARIFRSLGDFAAAEDHLRRAIELLNDAHTGDHTDIADALNNLAETLRYQQQFDAAIEHYQQAHAMLDRLGEGDTPRRATLRANVGITLSEMGRPAEAEPMLRAALESIRRTAGPESREAAMMTGNLAAVLADLREFQEAEALYRESLNLRRRIFGNSHPDVAMVLNNLGSLKFEQRDYAAAEPVLREALAIQLELYGEHHPDVALMRMNVAAQLHGLGRLDEAIALLRQALEGGRRSDARMVVSGCLVNLGRLMRQKQQSAEAVPLLEEALEINESLLGKTHPRTMHALMSLGYALHESERWEQSEARFREAVVRLRAGAAAQPFELPEALYRMGFAIHKLGRSTESNETLHEAIDIARSLSPANDSLVARISALLGELLVEERRFVEAEPLLLEAARLSLANAEIPAAGKLRLTQRITEMYEAWGKGEPAAEWRERQREFQSATEGTPASRPADSAENAAP